MSSLGNIHRERKTTRLTLDCRDTAWLHGVLWKHFVEGRWTHLNPVQEKARPRRPEIEMTSLIFMEPPGCRLANYDWPKKRVAAGHLWLSMVSSGPGTSIKQGQDGTVYETAWTHTVQYKINKAPRTKHPQTENWPVAARWVLHIDWILH